MEDRKYQVFISSTYTDLIKAREKIIETVLRLYHFPVGMEMFSADDDEQWEVIKDTIDLSDYYVVIIGHRYGSETTEGISYTEKEYDYAKEKGVPILAFIRKRDVATKPNERDDESIKIDKLNRFIEKASKNKVCEFWENEADLSTKVAIALPKIFRKTPRIGWVKADKAISPEVSEELARLSKENREAREEIEALKAKIQSKRPELDVHINERDHLELKFPDNREMEITLGKRRTPISFFKERETLSIDNVPNHLRSYVSESDIEKYNRGLPSAEKIDAFNKKLEFYWRIKETSLPISLTIINNGKTKAREVFVDIRFPRELLVLEKEDANTHKFPEIPFPENPIHKAEERYKKRQTGPFAGLNFDINRFSHLTPDITPFRETMADIMSSRDYSATLEDNVISLKLNSLLHTRKMVFDDFVIIPMKPGNYEIEISMICEEFDEEISKTITVAIVDATANNSIE
jgi:hypothetical protein